MHKLIEQMAPDVVVVDPISSLMQAADSREVKAWLVRLFDFLKGRGITAVVTCLTSTNPLEETDIGVSSLIDTWLEVRDLLSGGERTRTLHILKSRGMSHSNQVREFVLSNTGIELVDVYSGPDGVLTGAARTAQEAMERGQKVQRDEATARKTRELERRRRAVDSQIQALRDELAAEEAEAAAAAREDHARTLRSVEDRAAMNRRRTTLAGARKKASNS
jgi:circadian clock protein KaiC